jgi:transcriptional repressor NrdR
MKCPYCNFPEQRVLDSRPCRDGQAIRRRRECESCNRRFTTFEEIERQRLYLIKRDGSREEFSKEKMLQGLVSACRKRPVSHHELIELAARIERQLIDQGDTEVPSASLGKIVLDHLLKVDHVAYIRFASVYEQFETPAEFSKIVEFISLAHSK